MNIKERWDKWAEEKANKFNVEHLYEEALEISLVSRDKNLNPRLGSPFSLDFRIELGELDKLLGEHDKIDTQFSLKFPTSLIEEIKTKVSFLYNSGRFNQIENVRNELVKNINLQLEKKKKYFKVAIWNERMGDIIANELLEQFINQNQNFSKRLSSNFIEVPVRFHFGVFALQYIRDKYKFRMLSEQKVSLKQ